MEIIKSMELEYAKIALRSNGVLHIHFVGNYIITGKEAKAINDILGNLSENKEAPVLITAETLIQFDRTAREFSASPEGFRFTLAEALVVKNFAQKLIATFYISYDKPPKPSKVFTDETKAIDWLLNFKDEVD
ncbi:MAG: hypothetical protein IPM51_07715 [Sphingobacteriaceae bacterium]|nr:hypothetical protein [Sphingobacteriaceae bacterium]